jgi:hypothetical protein
MSEILDPWYSRPIDVHRWSDHPEVKGLTDKVWGEAWQLPRVGSCWVRGCAGAGRTATRG